MSLKRQSTPVRKYLASTDHGGRGGVEGRKDQAGTDTRKLKYENIAIEKSTGSESWRCGDGSRLTVINSCMFIYFSCQLAGMLTLGSISSPFGS